MAGIEWTILDKNDKGYLTITKNSIGNKMFSNKSNDWRSSSLREYLHTEFAKKITDELGADALVPFERDLLSLDGQTEYGSCEDVVSMLTFDEYRKYRKHLPNTGEWWWLITPDSAPCNGDSMWMTVVSPSGFISDNYYVNGLGVRPFCIFNSKIFESEEK
jgi:hypothetical protein